MTPDIPKYSSNDVDERINFLVQEGETIIQDYERIYDLAGRRLAVRSIELGEHFSKPENRVIFGILGYPNVGKTTYAFSMFKILDLYKVPVQYYDLDVYTQSGLAISEQVEWKDRKKRKKVPLKEIRQTLNDLKSNSRGLVIADFPGMLKDKHQLMRLTAVDMAVIIAKDIDEFEDWRSLCNQARVGSRHIVSRIDFDLEDAQFPQVAELNRRIIFSPLMIASATSVLEEAAGITNAPKSNYHTLFSQPEIMVLEEFLDFLVSIKMDG